MILGLTSIPVSNVGRLAQRESAPLTRERSLVQTQHRPPLPQWMTPKQHQFAREMEKDAWVA